MNLTQYGLILDLGNASNEDHTVGHQFGRYGLIGIFNRNTPTPLERFNIDLEDAKKYDKDPDCPLRLVKLDEPANNKTAVETADKGDDN